ncbi:Signal transduction histidine kinase [Halorubrum aquaticum]|uniref:histidine kinase n=1 Tax=Halorubrum aquaticum TaxID=387340 RepID=A0A1I3BNQ5_9EURY|nr:ATP-binding protein [Halorubrum aquaticum]SFH63915.1 Signal transduction histidine kinase [Halorubrum aquaticum]
MDASSSTGRDPASPGRNSPFALLFAAVGVLCLVVGTGLAVDAVRGGGSALVAFLDIVFFWIPGVTFVYAGYWLPRSEIPRHYYPRIVAWTFGGVIVMYGFIVLRDLHPGVTVEWSIGTQAIGLTIGSVSGFLMGVQRSKTTRRTEQLEERTRELEENERELERQNAQLERFASVVSHDLRNPLSVARGNLELVRDEYDGDRLVAVADAHARMEALIDDLLTLARQGEAIDATEATDLAEVSRVCWEQVSTDGATLSIDEPPTVMADRDRLRQLLENLFRNGVEHGRSRDGDAVSRDDENPPGEFSNHSTDSRASPDDGIERGGGTTITVGGLEGGFYVADDGPGIPESERDRVFDGGYSTAEQGTGFGLAIVAEIAEAHGWEVRVVESADGGARFEITGVEVVRA